MNRTTQFTIVVALATVLAVPLAQATFHIPDGAQDRSRAIDAGQYVSYRVDVEEPGRVVFSGFYEDVETDQPVLPVLLVLDKANVDDDQASIWATFVHWGANEPNQGSYTWLSSPVASDSYQTYQPQADGRGVEVSTPVDAGTWDVTVVTAPADGPARANIWIPEHSSIQAEETGTSLYERGIDESVVGYDTKLVGPHTNIRSWGYSGADIPFGVDTTLYGYMGGPHSSPAHWVNPSGDTVTDDFIYGGDAGDWTASFPAEQWQGPVCDPLTSCFPQPFVENPPYAFGADVGLGSPR